MKITKTSCIMFIFVLTAITSVHAQNAVTPVRTDPIMVVIPARSQEEVRSDIDNAEATKSTAVYRKEQADNRLKEINNSIDSRKAALKNVDQLMKSARKAKSESEITALNIESKANKQAIDLLEKLKDLRKAEIEQAKADADLADINIRVLRLENELQGKRAEYQLTSVSGVGELTATTAQQVMRELEVRLLKMQQEQADATQEVASKLKDVVKQRKKLHEAQLKLGMPRI